MVHYCLFDIDGTLLNSGGAGQAAMEAALAEVFDVDRPVEGISFAGRTDHGITSDLFRYHGLEVDAAARSRFLDVYLGRLPAELASRPGLVLPGVRELLATFDRRDDVVLGLLTGNFRRGAECKLRHFDLYGHFEEDDVGGFGDLHVERDDVAREAFGRVVAHHGSTVGESSVWVVGDTPADVQCGRAIGANVVAVATGHYPRADLVAAEPDHLFDDFADPDALLALLA